MTALELLGNYQAIINPLALEAEEKIYQIDLNTRQVEVPREFTVVETDHRAETIYFQMPRYYDSIDLTKTVGLVQYVNAKNEKHIYAIPFYDITSLSTEDNQIIVFPWRLAKTAAAAPGNLIFSFRFFKVDDNKQLVYNLNTLPQNITIYRSLWFGDDVTNDELVDYLASSYDDFLYQAAQGNGGNNTTITKEMTWSDF